MAKRYWLMKSEPDDFSWEDLLEAEDHTTAWTGVRNYQARNLMRDEMRIDDGVLFYHSNIKTPAIVGIARVSGLAHPDDTQFDRRSKYFDARSSTESPRWVCVDIQAEKELARPVSRDELKEHPELDGLMLLKKGARLSVQPVSREHWNFILRLARSKPTHS
ncbi:MAG: EVE domain-containing protein [Myxococcota bacterium]